MMKVVLSLSMTNLTTSKQQKTYSISYWRNTLMTRFIKVLTVAAILLGLCACKATKYESEPIYTSEPEEDIPLFEVPDGFTTLSFDKASEHWNDDKTIMVYSFEDCPHCAIVVPLLKQIDDEYGGSDINYIYVDVKRMEREAGNEVYDMTIEHFADELGNDGKMYVPFTVYLDKGNIVASHIGDEGIDGMSIKETLEAYLGLLINV